MKKIITCILCLSFLFTICTSAFAVDSSKKIPDPKQITYINHTVETVLTNVESSAYDIYEIDLSAISSSDNNTSPIDTILSLCSYNEAFTASNDWVAYLYQSAQLQNYLYDYANGLDIGIVRGILYIAYNTNNGAQVSLAYDNNGLSHKVIYFPENDYAVCDYSNLGGETIGYEGFTAGESVRISDEYIEQIYEYIEDNNLDALYDDDELVVNISETGNISVDTIYTQSRTRAEGFTTNSSLLSDLRSHFGEYTKVSIASYQKYSSALGRNVPILVRESRNNYVRKTADWKSFAIGTLVSLVSIGLGFATSAVGVAIAGAILTAVGVGISAQDTILSAVTLAKSAAFTYRGTRAGYAYDSTAYNAYVNVDSYTGTGEFHGGYDSAGNFTWIHYSVSSAFNKSADTIANKTINNYNADLVLNGVCTSYYPD